MKNVNQLLVVTSLVFILMPRKFFSQLNNHHKNYVDIGLVGGMQHHDSPLAGVYGSIGTFFNAFGRPSSIDVRVKELYIANPEQQGTLITLTYRVSLIKGLFVGIGGAHGHQVMMGEFMTHTGSSIGGTNPHIMHSSGYNAELGYNFGSFIKNKYLGIYPVVQLAYTQLFMTNHSTPNLTLSGGFRVGFKQWN
ncbi:MAG: hypothetical protein K0S53_360 [Bacteroidetes bacterium]|jgi:hypothetical protein|nr:hypothetical protein [Bacteroidota bacterium]MDF2453672.1 hypothetical protein [Bacteroidota bacterium]